jgi:hypothetical protein
MCGFIMSNLWILKSLVLPYACHIKKKDFIYQIWNSPHQVSSSFIGQNAIIWSHISTKLRYANWYVTKGCKWPLQRELQNIKERSKKTREGVKISHLVDWQNQYSKNGYTTKSNLEKQRATLEASQYLTSSYTTEP